MHEIFNTRHNPMIDPTLHIWGWQIPVYLFLGGLVAGMMIISGYFILTRKTNNKSDSGFWIPVIGLIALSLGMLSLFLDLEHKLNVWRMYATFQWTSPMSWGSWILLIVYPVLILNALSALPDKYKGKIAFVDQLSGKLLNSKIFNKSIAIISMIIGALLGLYTGVLLSALGARPAWNSAMLWMLFLVSGISSAAAFIHLFTKDKAESEFLVKADNGFLFLELIIILMIFIGFFSSSQIHIDAGKLFIGGPFSAVFWVFVMGIGIIVPLIIQMFAVNHKVQHTPIAPILVLFGGLMLRFVIVAAGQYSHWSTAFFK